MAKYSRMQKYKELRDSLQNDSESNIQTRDLYKYEQKLNQIAPDQFNAPQEPSPERTNSPLHASQVRPYAAEETPASGPASPPPRSLPLLIPKIVGESRIMPFPIAFLYHSTEK